MFSVHRSVSSKGTNQWQNNEAVSWTILTCTICDYIDNDIAAHGAEKQPTKLVIPDIFCNAPGTERTTNGMASSSSSSLQTDSNSILNPEFNERRHSESVTVAGKTQGSEQGRPRSEAAASHERLPQGVPHNGNGNPFQDDTKPVWAASSGVSSPEVIQFSFVLTSLYNHMQQHILVQTVNIWYLQVHFDTALNLGYKLVNQGKTRYFLVQICAFWYKWLLSGTFNCIWILSGTSYGYFLLKNNTFLYKLLFFGANVNFLVKMET